MKNLIYITASILLSSVMLAGCNSTGCTDNQNSVPLAGFYSMATGDAIAVDSLAISGVGAPNDSLLVGPSERASEVYLPLRSGETSTSFVIKYMQKALAQYGIEDRITFYYEALPWFASEECGAMYHYRITRVSHTSQLLDSIGIVDSLITNVERETIGLYFHTAEPEEPDVPDTPDTPSGPDEPDTPDTPTEPSDPTGPTEPEVPAESAAAFFCSGPVALAAVSQSREVTSHE